MTWFSSSHVWMWELDYKESWAPKNWCFWTVVLEKTLESPLDCKEIQPVHPKGNKPEYSLEGLMLKQNSNTLATWWEELTHWKRPWCWERLKVGREGDDRGWDGWMASPTQWTWIWASSRRCWRTGKPGVLQPMGSQGVGHDWVTEQLDMFKVNPYITRHTCPSWFPNLHPSVWSLGFALNFLLSETTPSIQVLLVPAPISLSNQLHSHPTN